ncbi:hypothetical protein M3Y99_01160400 [Aphelenchoides fujianensis]|nr:hypothetical protein M3Y99_01160400 [Aphelenchoides fujianensis]
MRGCWLSALFLLAFPSDVRALTCIDCGPLNLPTATCNQNKECYTGYCTYYNKTVQNRVELNFRCGSDQLNGPGGSVFSEINRCVVVQEGDTWYRMKICNDRDLCVSAGERDGKWSRFVERRGAIRAPVPLPLSSRRS